MNLAELILSNDLVRSIGQTILHSLWQGAAIGLISWLMGNFLGKHNRDARYWINVGSILSIILLAIITFTSFYNIGSANHSVYQSESSGSGFVNLVFGKGLTEGSAGLSGLISSSLPYITILWFIGMIFLSIRMLGGLFYIRDIKNCGTKITSTDLNRIVSRISINLNINKIIQLTESAKVSVPTVIGHIKPMILFPVGAIAGLPINQVEAIISHELAHIKRHDYLINLIFSVVEIMFFFNPVIWILNSQIKADRELLCDDLALEATGDPANYAKALTNVQVLAQGNLKLAPTFSGKKGHLLSRIQRIYNNKQMKSKTSKTSPLAVLIIMAGFIILFSSSIQPSNDFESKVESSEFATKVDTTVKTKIKHEGKVHDVILTWNAKKIISFKLDGKDIDKKDFGKYEAIIAKTKEIGTSDIETEAEIELIEEIEIEEFEVDVDVEVEVEIVEEVEEVERIVRIVGDQKVVIERVKVIEEVEEIELEEKIEIEVIGEIEFEADEIEFDIERIKLIGDVKVISKEIEIENTDYVVIDIKEKGKEKFYIVVDSLKTGSKDSLRIYIKDKHKYEIIESKDTASKKNYKIITRIKKKK